jgi:putative ABC transport system ATP-binding protein
LEDTAAVVRLAGITKSYVTEAGVFPVLKGIDLTIRSGELVAIMGPSGSGKSTLLNVIGLLDVHDGGTYHLAGEPMVRLSQTRAALLRNRLIGFVFQSFNLLADKTAIDNVAVPLYHQGVGRRERLRRAYALLDRVQMAPWAERYPSQLSGGQKQRVAVARALVTRPALLLADEPTGALDSKTSAEVMQLLAELHAEGQTVVIITHDPEVARQTPRVIQLRDGLITSDAPPA